MAEPDAAVAIMHAHRGADSVLLMRRASGKPTRGPGLVVSRGCREPEDRDLLQTALREGDWRSDYAGEPYRGTRSSHGMAVFQYPVEIRSELQYQKYRK
jgi:hypothetical protein